MDASAERLEVKINLKTEIKQENDTLISVLPEIHPVTNEPWIDLNKIKSEPENLDVENESNYFVTNSELRSITDIKTEGVEVRSKAENGAASKLERKRKGTARGVEKACQYCGKTFRDSHKLKKHVMDHTGERPFKCELCDSAFKERYNLSVHIKTHTGDRQIQCPECNKTFIVPSAMKAHMRTHSKEKPYVCDVCGRGFSHSANLKPHVATHSEEFPFHCLECGKSFRIRKGLLRHLRGHHANCTKEGCEFCAQFEKVKYKPRKYVKAAEKIRECPVCLQTFRYYMTYKNHMRAHNNENYTCSFCGKSYLDRAALRVHLRNHTGETPYVCGVCGKKFKRGDSYRYHTSTHSEERKLFHCDICNQDYTHRSSLLKHKRHVHEDERPFQCGICERRFKTPQVLRGHLRTHSDDGSRLPAPETCRICEKSVDKRGFKAHMRTHGISTFKCKRCKCVFEGQEAFDAHARDGCLRYRNSRVDAAVGKLVDVSDLKSTEDNYRGGKEVDTIIKSS
ncbi:zinc finger protein 26-like [Anoplophora glabripennis]|uniref:zinc finger protein 26-like n=1 Tax=Anoplophora glabripennis TaxID=217634 RepID=UPI000873C4C4|nr:zinc finger protein 26-like [Anoplophora glabripennis]